MSVAVAHIRPTQLPPRAVKRVTMSLYDQFLRPVIAFLRQFAFAVINTPLFIIIPLLPITSLLLLLPAFFPQESVIRDTVERPRTVWQDLVRRAFAVAIAVASFVALVVPATELVRWWFGLTGISAWLAGIVIVYVADLLILAGMGQIPLMYNLRNLSVRWTTTILTAAAFTVVVALLTVLLAFVNGMYKVIETSGRPANVIILGEGATDEVFSTIAFNDADAIERQRAVLDANGKALPAPVGTKRVRVGDREVPLCSRETFAIVNQPVPEENRRRFVQVRGLVDPQLSAQVHGVTLGSGSWYSSAGVKTPAGARPGERDQIEAVLGAGVARELGKTAGKPSLTVGDTFELGDRSWVIVGLMNAEGTSFGSEVWAKQDIVVKMFNKNGYSSLVLGVEDDGGTEATAARASALAYELKERFSNPKVNAQTESEYFNKQAETSKQFLIAILVVAAILAFGGVVGVMNTMFAAIAQRTRDIGVLRVLGFKRWQVLVSFLLESMAIAIIGGLIGCLVGLLCNGWSATSQISSGQGGGKTVVFKLIVDAKLILTGLTFTLVMGRLGGLIPALSAMRLKILDSLR